MGSLAPVMAGSGRMKRASKRDVLEIKSAAEKEGLVSWMMNEDSGKFTNASCSCCGCCCGALRTVSEFSQPGFIAPPHFMPHTDAAQCNGCGNCCKACPMGAMLLMGEGETARTEHLPQRCIGCGLCVTACTRGALALHEVPGYHKPPGNWLAYLARYTFNYLGNSYDVWRSRRHA
jgi:Na+-translocating ferredoxin:NAD+ oxidoreductase subunit B